MTDPTPATPESEALPRPDGLPRRRARRPTERSTQSEQAIEGGAPAGADDATTGTAVEEQGAVEGAGDGGEMAPEPGSQRSSIDIARMIVEAAEDKKAADIVLLDVTELTTMAEYFVICSGGSERQLGAIADGIAEGLREEHVRPIGREGSANSHWVLLDFGGVVVHIFAPPERDYYQLERHWSKAKTVLRVQ